MQLLHTAGLLNFLSEKTEFKNQKIYIYEILRMQMKG